jgi:hypothetical protein
MAPRSLSRGAAVAGVLLAAAAGLRAEGYAYEPKKRGDLAACLEVEVASRRAAPGLGRVHLTLTVTGPPTLEVRPAELVDAAAAWKSRRRASSWDLEGGRVTWTQTIGLEQVKPGPLPLPAVTVRFRDGPGSHWEDAEWDDVLKEPQPNPPPDPVPQAPPSRMGWWLGGAALALAGALTLAAVGWGWKRRRAHPAGPVPPDRRALQELDRIEGLAPEADGAWYHTQLSDVVRRFLAERFGLRAPQQTTAEFLEAVRRVPDLTDAQQALLRDLFERCDLAKFARAGTSPEECRRAADLARAIVRQTATGPSGKGGGGEPGASAPGGSGG